MTRPSISLRFGTVLAGALVVLMAAGCAPPTYSYTAVYVTGVTGATQIASGEWHSCAVVAGGAIRCWGSNYTGELGNGVQASSSYVPVNVTGLSGATQVAAGLDHSCALFAGGTVKCWGGGYGLTPVDVVGVSGATQVASGEQHACALAAGGTVKCWGLNDYGQLGNGTTNNVFSSTPVDVSGLSGAGQLDAGSGYTCAVMAGGAVKCWGRNGAGQLGDGTTTDSSVPVDVTGLVGATQVAAGGAATTCALVAGGAAKCWGSNQADSTYSSTPVDVVGLSGAVYVDAGSAMSCALAAGGSVRCWGLNIYGSLGTWTPTYYSATPVGVVGVSGATQIAAGGSHTCALVSAGAIKCWGADYAGQLGNGT